LERNYEAILDFASSGSRPITRGTALLAAGAHRLKGEPELAYAYYDSARAILEKDLDAHPDDPRIHRELGIAYAGLGRKDEAIREGRRVVELRPVSKFAWSGPYQVWVLAVIYTMVGEYDAALDEIEYLLSIPIQFSVHDLRLDPEFDPLRAQPRYEELLEKYAID
jgi:tetratricopeptide (TPR) repeat protein